MRQVRLPAGQRLINRAALFQNECVAGKVIQALIPPFVTGANRDFFSDAENVQEHNGQLVSAGNGGAIANGHRVEPTTAARPAGHRAVFSSRLANALADALFAVVQFSGEWPTADTSGVSLDDSNDPIKISGGHARAAPHSGRRAVRAS